MKVEYINAIIKAAIEVVNNFDVKDFRLGKPYVRKNPYATKDIVVMVGVTGELRGQVIFSMNEDIAVMIASNMMMGMPIDSFDEMAKSAISELGNIIMGTAATTLSGIGVIVDITPPSLVKGQNIEISSTGIETICVPIQNGLHDIECDISLK